MYKLSLSLFVFFALQTAMANALTLIGTYEVPIGARTELAQYARFTLVNYQVVSPTVDGKHVMSFELPSELTGVTQTVYFELQGDLKLEKFLSGPNGKAHCVGKWTEMSCRFQFANLTFDLKSAKQELKSKYDSSQVVASKVKIAKLFSNDPIGVASVRRPVDVCGTCQNLLGQWKANVAHKRKRELGGAEIAGVEGRIWTPSFKAELTNIQYHPNAITGSWSQKNKSGGFLLNLTNEGQWHGLFYKDIDNKPLTSEELKEVKIVAEVTLSR